MKAGGIYTLALTSYQYVVYPAPPNWDTLAWVLMPYNGVGPLTIAPSAYVTKDGRIGTQEGLTELTIDALDFTGRYA